MRFDKTTCNICVCILPSNSNSSKAINRVLKRHSLKRSPTCTRSTSNQNISKPTVLHQCAMLPINWRPEQHEAAERGRDAPTAAGVPGGKERCALDARWPRSNRMGKEQKFTASGALLPPGTLQAEFSIASQQSEEAQQ